MKTSPTQRSLAHYRQLGWTCAVTEHWNQYARIRQDLFGFIDLIAMKPGHHILAIQASTGAHHAARVAKIVSDHKVAPWALLWLQTGSRIHVTTWAKHGPRGKRKVWEVRVQELTLKDFSGARAVQTQK